MAPPIFSSVRSKSRPALLSSFRDDSSLVAFRYEKTAQAEPPRTVPPRASTTTLRPMPSDLQLSSTSTPASSPWTPITPNITSSSDAARNNSQSSTSSINSNNVIVVVSPSRTSSRPLRSPARPLTPPLEIHPALRDPSPALTSFPDAPDTPATFLTRSTTTRTRSSLFSTADTWKRDSGAPTTSSATIRGDDSDDCYDCCTDSPHYDPLYEKLHECGAEFLVTCSPAPPSVTRSSHDTASVYSTDNQHLHHTAHDRLSDARQEASSPTTTTTSSFAPVAVAPRPGGTAPIETQAPPPRSLVKSLSSRTRLGLSSGSRLRKRSSTNKSSTSTSTTDSSPSSVSAASSALSALAAAMSLKISVPGDSISRRGSASAAVGGGPATGATGASSPATPTKKSPNLSPASAPANSGLELTTGAGSSSSPVDPDFSPLSIAIPDDRLLDDDFMTNFTFSNRGSVMFGGRRAVSHSAMSQQTSSPSEVPATAPAQGDVVAPSNDAPSQHQAVEANTPGASLTPPTTAAPTQDVRPASANPAVTKIRPEENNSNASTGEITVDRTSQATTATPSIRIMSVEAEKDSQKVRSLYESGEPIKWEDGNRLSPLGERIESVQEQSPEDAENDAVPELHPPVWASHRSTSSLSTRPESTVRREYELAGGIEDWEDVHGGDVDRYGFITPRRPESRVGTPTELKSAQYAPRRRNVLVKRDLSGLSSSELNGRSPSRKVSARSLNTQNSERSVRSRRSTRSAIRQASNYLPHNRNRRWMDEAGDMLTLAPGLQDMMEDAHLEKISEAIKKKETERSEKWRKMAKVVKKGKDGEGMEFEFDMKNPKLIERTWKGIPDRWRASAWYSFMATSARNRKGSPAEEQLKADFHRFQEMGSPDDVQIDLDVPRTINRHIMFRRRYRGGQRLLFRVLHALSLYFPDVGYVQGMASLAATLLCYFDEERCFVMLVRMWQMRGLEQLYQPGFEGLMTALKDLETQWLGGKDVARKLAELCIDSTAYGTRWYLTLFNLSIPFQAQLRVWDVFLLLGDQPERPSTSHTTKAGEAGDHRIQGIDIVHATSAALINALGEVLLDSDFENAMKALTSWIPIKDEDLLMKVTKVEWKAQQGRKKA